MADFKDNLLKENTPILESDLSAIEKVSKIALIVREAFEAEDVDGLDADVEAYFKRSENKVLQKENHENENVSKIFLNLIL